MKHLIKVSLFFFIFTILYACSEQTYTITFDVKGGIMDRTEIIVQKGESLILSDFEPTKTYFSFDYWYVDDEYTPFMNNGVIKSNLVLQAKWTPYQFMVIFKDANQGSDVVTTVIYPNQTTSYTPSPRDNFVFLGWYRNQDLSLAFTFGQTLTEHITLYPKWQQINPDYILVTFDANEGEDVEPVLVDYDTILENVPTPVRLGYTFLGWFLDDNLFDFSNTLTEDFELIAMWEQDIYTVSFESNGGTTVIAQTYTYGELFVLPTTPRKANHVFNQWLYHGTPVTNQTPVTSSLTLQAEWSPIYQEQGQYRTYAINFLGFNIHQIQNENSLRIASLINDTLYKLDLNWDLAIELGLAEFIGDFTHSDKLPITYRSSMAMGDPIKVDTHGFVWEIQLKSGLKFSDNTPINAYTFEYSWKQLISSQLMNDNAYYLYDDNYLPLVNAESYFKQTNPTTWEEVGFEVLDEETFRISLEAPYTKDYLMSVLSSLALGVVHPQDYENEMIQDQSKTNYGQHPHLPVSYGPYVLSSWTDHMIFDRQYINEFDHNQYLLPQIKVLFASHNGDVYQMFMDNQIDDMPIMSQNAFEYKNLETTKYTFSSTFFYLELNLDFGRDQDDSNDNTYLQYKEFRYALYYGFDRQSYANGRINAVPQGGILSFAHYSHINNPMSYRQTFEFMTLPDESIQTSQSYNPQKAKYFFDLAYQRAIDDGYIVDGDKISLTFTFQDVGTSYTQGDFMKANFESIFGTDKFELIRLPLYNPTYSETLLDYTYDMVIRGVQGADNHAPQIVQYLYNWLTYSKITDTPSLYEVSIHLPHTKQALESVKDSLLIVIEPTLYEIELLSLITSLLTGFSDDTYTGDMNEIVDDLYLKFMHNHDYPHRFEEMDLLTWVLETMLLDDMLIVPMIAFTHGVHHRIHIGLLFEEMHPKLGFGGFQYMYIKA